MKTALSVSFADFAIQVASTLFGHRLERDVIISRIEAILRVTNDTGSAWDPRGISIPKDFFLSPTYLLPRETCESDPSYLQLIPYIVLRHEGKIFTYQRGKAGDEPSLHGKLSIGVGGHIDSLPTGGNSLESWCNREAERNLFEKLGLSAYEYSPIVFTSLLADRTNPVNSTHIGLFAVVDVQRKDFTTKQGVIENGEWLDLADIDRSRLEAWSIFAVRELEFN